MSETEQRLQALSNAILAGSAEQARYATNAALARGCTPLEVLDSLVDAVSILVDLDEVGEYDESKVENAEAAVNSCLTILEGKLAESEGRFKLTATVGPVGIRAGGVLASAMTAALRSVGLNATGLPKTQTARELLRNSEELRVDLVVPLLTGDRAAEQVNGFVDEWRQGGFASKFDIIAYAPGFSADEPKPDVVVARNSEEALTMVAEWALKKHSGGRKK